MKRNTLTKFARLCESDWRAAIKLIDATPGETLDEVVDKLTTVRKAQAKLQEALALAGLVEAE